MSESTWVTRQFIYIGDRLGRDGKLQTGFILLPIGFDWNEISPRMVKEIPASWWTFRGASRTVVNRLRVGAVVSMEAEGNGEPSLSIRPATLRTLATVWHDPEAVMLWTAEHRADRAETERRREMKERDALHEALDPVREMYGKLRGRHRTAILAEIVRYITSGS